VSARTITAVGAGGIGGNLAGCLKLAGERVQVVEVGPHLEAIRAGALRLEGIRGEHQVCFDRVCAPNELRGPLDIVLLATRAGRALEALAAIEPHLAADSVVIVTENGLNAQKVAARIGERRTIPCMVHMVGSQLGPGVVRRYSEGEFYLGELDGSASERTQELAELLSQAVKTNSVENVWGYIWCKLIHCAQNSTTALVDAAAGEVRSFEWARRALVAIELEVVDAARAAGIRLERYERIDPTVLYAVQSEAGLERALAMLPRGSDKGYSGIWRELKLGIPTEVDDVTGEVVRIGRQHGLPMTLTGLVVEMILEISAGRRRQAWENLERLREPAEQALAARLGRSPKGAPA
jgi:2-dehydropantoate 2-reductase